MIDIYFNCGQGWGLTVILGIHPSPRMLPLHPMELFDGRRIIGSVFGDFKGKSQLPHLADQCIKGVKYKYIYIYMLHLINYNVCIINL